MPQTCPQCKETRRFGVAHSSEEEYWWRNFQYDAYFCPKCWVWLKGPCTSQKCDYCVGRPPTPPKMTAEQYDKQRD